MPIDRCLPRKLEARLTQNRIPAKEPGNKINTKLFQYLSAPAAPGEAFVWCKSVFLLKQDIRQFNAALAMVN
jgi:hypothetical protein